MSFRLDETRLRTNGVATRAGRELSPCPSMLQAGARVVCRVDPRKARSSPDHGGVATPPYERGDMGRWTLKKVDGAFVAFFKHARKGGKAG